MTDQNWVVFGAVDWNDVGWQIPHQLCASASARGINVLYVESTGLRVPSVRKDWKRIVSRLKNSVYSQSGFSPGPSGITVLTPLVLPFPANKIAVIINSYLIEAKVKKWILASGRYNNLIFVTFLPTPLIRRLIASFEPKGSIYYMADDMTGLCNQKQRLRVTEEAICKQVSIVATTSQKLRRRALLYRDDVGLIPAGLDASFLTTSCQTTKPAPTQKTIGFVGGIGTSDDKIDQELLVYIATVLDDFEFVFIGRQYANISNQLRARKNVHFIGHLSHEQMKERMNDFSAGIIPYRVNEYTESVHPCKVYEYLALGMPVISTALPEIENMNREHEDIISIAYDYDDFAQKIRKEVSRANDDYLRKRRIGFAQENSWENRYLQLAELIENAAENQKIEQAGTVETLRINQIPIRLARRIRSSKRRNTLLGFIILIGVTATYSPLTPLIGFMLKMKDRPASIETIIALAGDGEGRYFNKGIDKRAAELLRITRVLKPRHIVISSTRTPKQVEMLRNYLQAKGFDMGNLTSLQVTAATTASHLKRVAQTSIVQNSKSIYVLSAPLHERRAVVTLRRELGGKDIQIYANGIDRAEYAEKSISDRPGHSVVLLYELLALAKTVIFKD